MKKLSRKGIVLGIIILFIGASLIPIINGDIGQFGNNVDMNEVEDYIEYIGNQEILLENGPEEEWNMTFGGHDLDVGRSIVQISDGYVFVGRTKSFGNGGYDLWLVKIDNKGMEIWNRTYGGVLDDWGCDISYTNDECFIVAGYTDSFGDDGVWLLKIDFHGNELWNKTFGDQFSQGSWSIEETMDGGFIISGYTNSKPDRLFDGWIIKTDCDGNEQWSKTYGGLHDEWILEVHQTLDNGYICIGGSYSDSSGGADVWLFKIDINGNIEWMKLYGGQYHDNGFSVKETYDGGFILTAESERAIEDNIEPNFYAWLIRTDSEGSVLWNRTFGEIDHDTYGTSIQETPDGGFIFSAIDVNLQFENSNILLFKGDVAGNIQWERKIVGAAAFKDFFAESHVYLTSDDGYIVISCILVENNVDAWVIKFPFFENNRPSKPEMPIGSTNGKIHEELSYNTLTHDPDGENVEYLFDWGDGSDSGWLGPYESGEEIEASYTWNEKGNFEIKVKARDIHGGESEWSDPLVVSMPKNRALEYVRTHMLFDLFNGRFPIFNFLINSLEEKI